MGDRLLQGRYEPVVVEPKAAGYSAFRLMRRRERARRQIPLRGFFSSSSPVFSCRAKGSMDANRPDTLDYYSAADCVMCIRRSGCFVAAGCLSPRHSCATAGVSCRSSAKAYWRHWLLRHSPARRLGRSGDGRGAAQHR
jgi:hypothetical protein